MISDPQSTDIEIEANQGFEAGWNRAQVALQVLIGIVVCAGIGGAFGDGWLATTARSFPATPIHVTYQRLLRANAPTDIIMAIDEPVPDGALTLGVGSGLLERASVGSTQPGAAEVTTTARSETYTFRLGPDHTGHITMKLTVRRPGPVDMVLTANGERLVLPLFIYP